MILMPPTLLEYGEPAVSYIFQDSLVILSACQAVRYRQFLLIITHENECHDMLAGIRSCQSGAM